MAKMKYVMIRVDQKQQLAFKEKAESAWGGDISAMVRDVVLGQSKQRLDQIAQSQPDLQPEQPPL
jgi:hypothetical protein